MNKALGRARLYRCKIFFKKKSLLFCNANIKKSLTLLAQRDSLLIGLLIVRTNSDGQMNIWFDKDLNVLVLLWQFFLG